MKPTTPNIREILYRATRRPYAIIGSMKWITILFLCVAATTAPAQTVAHKSPKHAGSKTIPNEIELRAAAATNLQARCALDFRWRDITNRISIQKSQVQAAADALHLANERAGLAVRAKQSRNYYPRAVKAAQAEVDRQGATLAALKLQKLNIEAENRKLLRVPR